MLRALNATALYLWRATASVANSVAARLQPQPSGGAAAADGARAPLSSDAALDLVAALVHANFQCAICQGLVVEPHLLSCSHRFCGACIRPWTRSHDTCPTCRTVMRGPPALERGVVCA